MQGWQFIAPALRLALRMGQKNRPPRHLGLKIVAVILLGVAVIFALVALHGYLRLHFSAVLTNAIFAGGFALLALGILLGVHMAQRRYQPPTLAAQMREETRSVKAQFAGMQNDLQRSWHEHEKTWLLGAAVLGVLLGAQTRGKRRKPQNKS